MAERIEIWAAQLGPQAMQSFNAPLGHANHIPKNLWGFSIMATGKKKSSAFLWKTHLEVLCFSKNRVFGVQNLVPRVA